MNAPIKETALSKATCFCYRFQPNTTTLVGWRPPESGTPKGQQIMFPGFPTRKVAVKGTWLSAKLIYPLPSKFFFTWPSIQISYWPYFGDCFQHQACEWTRVDITRSGCMPKIRWPRVTGATARRRTFPKRVQYVALYICAPSSS